LRPTQWVKLISTKRKKGGKCGPDRKRGPEPWEKVSSGKKREKKQRKKGEVQARAAVEIPISPSSSAPEGNK